MKYVQRGKDMNGLYILPRITNALQITAIYLLQAIEAYITGGL